MSGASRTAGRAALVAFAAAAVLVTVAAPARAQQASDPLGAPGRYTILRGDDLFVSRRGFGGAGSVGWSEATPALDGFAAQSPFVAGPSSAAGPPNATLFPQARGRFRDALADRVLALRQLQTPTGLIFDLASPNSVAEPAWMTMGEPGGSLPAVRFPVPNPEANIPSALATGDLDGVADADGNLHDEAVIAFEGADHSLQVRVADYNAAPGQATVTGAQDPLPAIGGPGDPGRPYVPGSLAAGIGDFDGDGHNEIAIAWRRRTPSGGDPSVQNTVMALTLLRYTRDPATHPKPSLVAITAQLTLPDAVAITGVDTWPSYEMAVADLDGQPGDEIAISQIGSNRDVDGASITLVGLNAGLALAHVGQGVVSGLAARGIASSQEWRPRLAAGLFHVDPAQGFTLTRRGLAIQWLGPSGRPVIQVFDVVRNAYRCSQATGDQSPCDLELIALTPQVSAEDALGSGGNTTMGFAAGGFAGTPATGDPQPWSLATSSSRAQTVKLWKLVPNPGAAQPYTLTQGTGFAFGNPGLAPDQNPGLLGANLTAYDRQGRSLVLGAPLRMTLEALPRPTLIFEDPPKHVDWLGGRFVNVSRTPEINVALSDETKKEFSDKTTVTSDWTIGASVKDTVKVTASEGLEGLEKAKDSLQVSAGIKGSYNADSADYNAHRSSYQLAIKDATADDDLVGGAYHTVTIWRYPILGRVLRTLDGRPVTDASGHPLHGFYELQIPATVHTINPPVGGRGLDWYQPLHENGNVLSYPQVTTDGLVPIDDLGQFELPNDATPRSGPLVNVPYAMDPTSPSVDLDISGATQGGSDRSNTSTLGANAEVKDTAYVSVGGVLLPGGSLENTFDVKLDSEKSWGTITTSDHSTESATGFSVEQKGSVIQSRAYDAATAYYYSTSGTQKVTHAVDLTSNQSGSDFWRQQSYARPDPALNLPFRIDMTKSESTGVADVPQWSSSPTHQRLRQFFVVHPDDPAKPLASGAPLNTSPVAGQTVGLQVRVYNYSLGSATGSFLARFVAVPIDDATGTIEDDPVDIGTVGVPSLAPRANALVSVPWKTKGPVDSSASQLWRIFVILDPGNQIKNETHEWQDRYKQPPTVDGEAITDPFTGLPETLEAGQNNQGYGLLTVHAATGDSPRQIGARTASSGRRRRLALRHRDIHLRRGAMAVARPDARFRRSGARARVDRPLLVRVRVEARRRHRRHHVLLLYDGTRRHRGALLGAETVRGVSDRRGAYVTFTWLPRTAGRHRLYARVIEQTDDGRRGNARAHLDVRVRALRLPRPRPRALIRLVRQRALPAAAERQLVALVRNAGSAVGRGDLRAARHDLQRFSVATLTGQGVTVARRDAAELRFVSRRIRRDLRIERVPDKIRALRAAPALRQELLSHDRRAVRALAHARLATARVELLALVRRTRNAERSGSARQGRPLTSLARRIAAQLRAR